MLILIGDVHGKTNRWKQICRKHENDTTIVLGDFGMGFGEFPFNDSNTKDVEYFLTRESIRIKHHLFIRGNHDNPNVCRNMKNYLGDYGIFKYNNYKIFYCGGGDSIDKHKRICNISWWENEQLSYQELQNAIEIYCNEKPDIVISHEPPTVIKADLGFMRGKIETRTSQAFDRMLELFKPRMWIFAHMHISYRKEINSTLFIGLNELEIFEIN